MGASDVEEATTENRKGWLHVQDEDSPALVLWHAALLAATLLSCARAPLDIAGPSSDGPFDVLADLVFLGEVFVQFVFPLYDGESRELVDDVRQIRDRYLHSRRFYVNIVLALPLCSSYIKPLARATAVVRSLRAAKCKPTLLSLRGTLQRVRDVAVAVELVELATVLLYATLLTLVLAGARWAPRLPYDARNLVLTIIVITLSLALHAVAFANLQSASDAMNVVEAHHDKQTKPVLQFLDESNVDDDTQLRVRAHFDYLMVKQGGLNDDRILAELPASLVRRVRDQNRLLLVKVPFFSPPSRPPKFLDAVVDALSTRVFLPNQWLVEPYSTKRELFVLREGVAIVISGRQTVATLTRGDVVGDWGCILGGRATLGVRAGPQSFVEALALDHATLSRIIAACKPHPDDAFRAAVAEKRDRALAKAKIALAFRKKQGESTEADGGSGGDGGQVAGAKTPGPRPGQGAEAKAPKRRSKDEPVSLLDENDPGVVATKARRDEGLERWRDAGPAKKVLPSTSYRPTQRVVMPDSTGRFVWDCLLVLLLAYACVRPQLRLLSNGDAFDASLIMDYACDLLFAFDLVLRLWFFGVHVEEDGREVLVVDRRDIFKQHVASKRFWIDAVSTIPFDLLGFVNGRWWRVLRLPHVTRILNLDSYIRTPLTFVEEHLELNVDARTVPLAVQLGQLAFTIVTVACVRGTRGAHAAEAFPQLAHGALRDLMTVDYVTIKEAAVAKRHVDLVLAVGLVAFFATLVSRGALLLRRADLTDRSPGHARRVCEAFLASHHASVALRTRIDAYLAHLESSGDGARSLAALPPDLRNDVEASLLKPAFDASPLLRDLDGRFRAQLAAATERHVYAAGDVLSNNEGAFYLKAGAVEIFRGDDVVTRLGPRDGFGEDALLDAVPATYGARAASIVEAWHLPRRRFLELLRQFPAIRERRDELRSKPARFETVAPRRAQIVRNSSRLRRLVRRTTARNRALSRGKRDDVPARDAAQTRAGHAWNVAALSFVLFNVMKVPFDAAFREGHSLRWFDWLPYYAGDVLLAIDALVWHSHGVGAASQGALLATVPFDVFALAITDKNLGAVQRVALCRLPKLLRVLDLPSLARACANAAEAFLKCRLSNNARSLAALAGGYALTAHLCAVGFFWCANSIHLRGGASWAGAAGFLRACSRGGVGGCDVSVDVAPDPKYLDVAGRAFEKRAWSMNSALDAYVAALLWAFGTLTARDQPFAATSGREVAFASGALGAAIVVFAVVVATLEDAASAAGLSRSLFLRRLERATRYCDHQQLPVALRRRFLGAYDRLWAAQRGASGGDALARLPDNLRRDFVVDVAPHLSHLFYVRALGQADLVHELAARVSLEHYARGDVLFGAGERADAAFCVTSGVVDVLGSGDGLLLGRFSTQVVLGEGEFIERALYAASARCVRSTRCVLLTHDAFLEALRRTDQTGAYREKVLATADEIPQLRTDARAAAAGEAVRKTAPERPSARFWEQARLVANAGGLLWFATTVPFLVTFASSAAGLPVGVVVADGLFLALMAFDLYLDDDAMMVDFASVAPLGLLAHACRLDRSVCASLRALQLIMLHRGAERVDAVLKFLAEEKRIRCLGAAGAGAAARLLIVFCLAIHWVACLWYGLARFQKRSWVDAYRRRGVLAYDMKTGSNGDRRFWYRASLTWAFSTITSFGDGGADATNPLERAFQILVMAAGVLLCDVNVLAVLASIVELNALQRHRNLRRTICARKFMGRLNLEPELRKDVLDYFDYVDENKNLDEALLLREVGRSCREDVLRHFAFRKLCDSIKFGAFQEGVVASLVRSMAPRTAAPGEIILEGNDDAYYVLRAGRAHTVDACGHSEPVSPGMLLAQSEFVAAAKRVGPCTRLLELDVYEAIISRAGTTHPYVRCVTETVTPFGVSVKRVESGVRKYTKRPHFDERFELKVYANTTCCVHVLHHRRGLDGIDIGRVELRLGDGAPRWHTILDGRNRPAGRVRLAARTAALPPSRVAASAEVTVVADTFCHLYVLAAAAQEDLRRYMRAMRLPLAKRLPADARADVAMKRDRALAKARNVAAAIRPFAASAPAPASPTTGDVEAMSPSEAAPASRARPATRGALRATLRAGTVRSTPSFSRSVRRTTQRGRPATPFSRVARVAPAAIFEEGEEDEAV